MNTFHFGFAENSAAVQSSGIMPAHSFRNMIGNDITSDQVLNNVNCQRKNAKNQKKYTEMTAVSTKIIFFGSFR